MATMRTCARRKLYLYRMVNVKRCGIDVLQEATVKARDLCERTAENVKAKSYRRQSLTEGNSGREIKASQREF